MSDSILRIWRQRELHLKAGPATIISPSRIRLLMLAPRSENARTEHQVKDEDERVLFFGDFSRFHLYLIVTHTKFRIDPSSVKLLRGNRFAAKVYFERWEGRGQWQNLWFRSPLEPIENVIACSYGQEIDSFALYPPGCGEQKIACDLKFITSYCTRNICVPAKIEYIGMSAKSGSEVKDRFKNGHNKLVSILAETIRRHPFRDVSIFMYKPGELEGADLPFPTVVEALEAGLISFFKPKKHNIEHINFPGRGGKLLEDLKAIGTDVLHVELEAPDRVSLYSEGIPMDSHLHQTYIPLIGN